MGSNVHFGDGVLDNIKADVNSRTTGLVKMALDTVFDYLEDKVKELPEVIKRLRNSTEAEHEIAAL